MQKSPRQPLVCILDAAGCLALAAAAVLLGASVAPAAAERAALLVPFALSLKVAVGALAAARIIEIVRIVRASPRHAAGARSLAPATGAVEVTPGEGVRRAA